MKFVAILLVFMSGVALAGWEKLPPLPEGNGGFVVAADNDGITILGGTNWSHDVKRWLKGISHYSPKTNSWKTIAKLDEPVGYGLSGVAAGTDGRAKSVVMLGGSNGKHPVKAMAIVDSIKTVLIPAPGLPDTIVVSAGGVVGDQFIIAGGTNDAANLAGLTNHAFAFDLTKRATVAALPDYPGKPFGTAASAVVGDELLIFGGANWNEENKAVMNTAVACAFNSTKRQWRRLAPYPIAARGVTAVALDDHRIYLAGGFADPERFLNEAFIYDVRTDTYTKATSLPYAATVSLVLQDGFVYCLGGEDQKKHRTDSFYRIRFAELLSP